MMDERGLVHVIWSAAGEERFRELAQCLARHWRKHGPCRLLIGLEGPLGAGKTTWVRGMLRGLGYRGRVPSPTYSLLEHYELGDITLVHIDLYRLPEDPASARQAFELEAIGVNDWLAQPDAWLLVEWPGRSEQLIGRCDVLVEFEITGATERRVSITPHSPVGTALLSNMGARSAWRSALYPTDAKSSVG